MMQLGDFDKVVGSDNEQIYRGSYMSVHVLLNLLLNELGEKDKMWGFAKHLIGFRQPV